MVLQGCWTSHQMERGIMDSICAGSQSQPAVWWFKAGVFCKSAFVIAVLCSVVCCPTANAGGPQLPDSNASRPYAETPQVVLHERRLWKAYSELSVLYGKWDKLIN